MLHSRYICLAVMALLASTALAQTDPLVTDRPDQTESSVTVFPGKFQFETGYTHSEDDEAERVRTDSFPEFLMRYGLIENFELRLGWAGYQWQKTTANGMSATQNGSQDMAAGIKLRFQEEDGWIPETALLAGLNLPVGQTGISSERVDPSFRFAFSHTLNDMFSFGYNLGAEWNTAENTAGDLSQQHHLIYTAALGMGLTESLGAFVEFFGDIPTFSNSPGPANSFDGGFTYLLSDNVQLDASAGVGLSKAADDWFASIGVSFRLPN